MEERARRTNRNNNTTTSHSNHPSKLFDAIKDPPLGFFPKKFIDFLTGTWIFKLYFSSARWFPRVFFSLSPSSSSIASIFPEKNFQRKLARKKKSNSKYCDSNGKILGRFYKWNKKEYLYILILIFASTLFFLGKNWNDKRDEGKNVFSLHLWFIFFFFFFFEIHSRTISLENYIFIYMFKISWNIIFFFRITRIY